MRPDMITQIIRKKFFGVTDACACNWRNNFQRILVCNSIAGRKIIPASQPYVTDVLCN